MTIEPQSSSARILFVDDDQVVRELAGMLMRQLGLTFVAVPDGFTAERTLRDHGPFDLALVDYSMPGRNGLETILVLRELQPALRVVLISGANPGEIDDLAQIEPLAGFLQKPFQYSEAVALLRQLTAPESSSGS